VSKNLENTVAKAATQIGSPYWMAPEIFQSDTKYDNKVDIWSLGITAIEMALGKPPLSNLHPIKAALTIPKAPPPTLPDDAHFSADFQNFVISCLDKDPVKRPSAQQLFRHPWMRKAKGLRVIQELVYNTQPLLDARRKEMREEDEQPDDNPTVEEEEEDDDNGGQDEENFNGETVVFENQENGDNEQEAFDGATVVFENQGDTKNISDDERNDSDGEKAVNKNKNADDSNVEEEDSEQYGTMLVNPNSTSTKQPQPIKSGGNSTPSQKSSQTSPTSPTSPVPKKKEMEQKPQNLKFNQYLKEVMAYKRS